MILQHRDLYNFIWANKLKVVKNTIPKTKLFQYVTSKKKIMVIPWEKWKKILKWESAVLSPIFMKDDKKQTEKQANLYPVSNFG